MGNTMSKGFTLIELVIVIIILSAIGIATTSYISTGVTIYTDITDRDKSINSLRFVIERMRREVAGALPNSARVDGNCLIFTPIIASSLYGYGFPILPLQASSAAIATIEKDVNGANKVQDGDKAVVYLLDSGEIANNGKLISINNDQNIITFTNGLTGYTLGSPAKRIYFIRDDVSYCFTGLLTKKITRQLANGDAILMAENITGSFTVEDATLQRNSLVQVKFLLDFDGQEAAFEETLHINNVP